MQSSNESAAVQSSPAHLDTESVIYTSRACRLDNVIVNMNGMSGDGASIALRFCTESATGLQASFHGTTDEMRQFAAELIRHADITDQAQLDRVSA